MKVDSLNLNDACWVCATIKKKESEGGRVSSVGLQFPCFCPGMLLTVSCFPPFVFANRGWPCWIVLIRRLTFKLSRVPTNTRTKTLRTCHRFRKRRSSGGSRWHWFLSIGVAPFLHRRHGMLGGSIYKQWTGWWKQVKDSQVKGHFQDLYSSTTVSEETAHKE